MPKSITKKISSRNIKRINVLTKKANNHNKLTTIHFNPLIGKIVTNRQRNHFGFLLRSGKISPLITVKFFPRYGSNYTTQPLFLSHIRVK